MSIHSFFEKDINRAIETVIKADDRDNISNEVSEYVITQEISKKIRDFFQAYNDYAGANGVWISGFFGSGKSHLLKILSYVLENKEFDGYKSGELFAEKIEGDEMLKADVLASTRIPSESILFNIDQQAQITSKTDANAILSVFYKVFYDHLGYYGFQPHVAEFEMWLEKQKKYQHFQEKFEKKIGKPWTKARIDYFDPAIKDTIAESLAEMNGSDSSKYLEILDELEDKQKHSIEDFCLRVQEYIKSKPAGFRLNFFVDEVGQYISDNTKLMLNLQTIAETLATKTKGSSWILVTSQEDMEKVVGDMTKKQQNDFTRIQARFKIKVPLTSANVDEVIEKRLLKKKQDAQKHLSDIYKKETAHLESLLSFSEAGVQFKSYISDEDFANKYPFAPYQFDLFQQCRRALSTHNAFQGKHSSIGERSMLGVFQQVIQSLAKKNDRSLVSFDLMFEGLRNELKGEIQSSIILAENQLDNKFAIKVLKTLFLVKYYGNFKATQRNISVLLLDNIDCDLKEHDRKITEALNTLENQSYIQRNGEFYEFLTDDEKDVEEEIKNTDVDDSAITELLKEILFDEIIRDNKLRFADNKQDYDFTSKVDGIVLGREKELEIEIITENFNDYENTDFIKAQTMGNTGMKLVMASDAVFMKDIRFYLKTNKYVKQNQSTSNRPEVKRILQEKAQLNASRRRDLVTLANTLLAQADVYLNGSKLEMGASNDGKTKVVNAFQSLIKTVYPSLRMIGNTYYSEDTIKTVIHNHEDDLFGTDDKTISEAESEILNIINRRKSQAERTSLSDIRNIFVKKPYGWYPNAIWTITAKLFKRGKIEIKQDSNLLEDNEVLNALLNSANHNTTLLEPQATFNTAVVNALKKVYSEAFDESCGLKEAKDIAVAFRDKLKDMKSEVKTLLAQKSEYPFMASLDSFSENLSRWSTKEYTFYLANLSDFENELLDTKENYLAPIKRFMNGDQRSIYDSIRKMLNGDTSNLGYIEGDELKVLKSLLENAKPFAGTCIRDAKSAKESLQKKVLQRIEDERKSATEAIEGVIEDLKSKPEFVKLTPENQQYIIHPILTAMQSLKNERYIAVIRDVKNNVLVEMRENMLNQMLSLANPLNKGDGTIKEQEVKYISRASIKPVFDKTELQTEEDVDEYVEALRKAYKEQINKKRRISI